MLCVCICAVSIPGTCRGQRTLDLESEMLKRYYVNSGSELGPLQE